MTTSNRLPHCFRWAATALATAVFALASQLALAHGGHHAEPQAASQPTSQAVTAPAGNEQASVAAANTVPSATEAAWSQSCPDGSGGDCCCKHQPVNPGVAKIALVNVAGWMHPTPLFSSRLANRLAETLPQQPAVTRALPRAPPFFS